MKRILTLGALVALITLFSACGLKTADFRDGPSGGTAPKRQYAVDATKIYGTWEGDGTSKDGSGTYHQKFIFAPGITQLQKTCFFPHHANLSTDAQGSTFDNPAQGIVTLAGGLYSVVQLDGFTCKIDFPTSLEFRLRNGTMYVGIQNVEKQTLLTKTADQ